MTADHPPLPLKMRYFEIATQLSVFSFAQALRLVTHLTRPVPLARCVCLIFRNWSRILHVTRTPLIRSDMEARNPSGFGPTRTSQHVRLRAGYRGLSGHRNLQAHRLERSVDSHERVHHRAAPICSSRVLRPPGALHRRASQIQGQADAILPMVRGLQYITGNGRLRNDRRRSP